MSEAAPAYGLEGKRVWVAGHRGMVGSALVRRLEREPCEVLTATRGDADLRNRPEVDAWIERNRPEAILLAAATVGGIAANNSRPAEFIYDNTMIAANVIDAAYRNGVERLVFLGSSCIYPRMARQPMREDELLSGQLEPTNQWYAIAKIAGLKMCEAYRKQYGCDYFSAMPSNLYGPGDNFDLESSHVLSALIAKAHLAKTEGQPSLSVWGSGTPRREFLYVDDAADGVLRLLTHYRGGGHVNLGSGSDVTILELARLVCEVVGFDGDISLDRSRPDGTPQKLLDVARMRDLGWSASTPLRDGIRHTYDWFLEHVVGYADRRALYA